MRLSSMACEIPDDYTPLPGDILTDDTRWVKEGR